MHTYDIRQHLCFRERFQKKITGRQARNRSHPKSNGLTVATARVPAFSMRRNGERLCAWKKGEPDGRA
jgi:hypothetical protein